MNDFDPITGEPIAKTLDQLERRKHGQPHRTNPNMEWFVTHGVGEWRVKPCVGNALDALPDARKDVVQRKPVALPKLQKRAPKDRIIVRRGVNRNRR